MGLIFVLRDNDNYMKGKKNINSFIKIPISTVNTEKGTYNARPSNKASAYFKYDFNVQNILWFDLDKYDVSTYSMCMIKWSC